MNRNAIFSRDRGMAVLNGKKFKSVPSPSPGFCHGCYFFTVSHFVDCLGMCQSCYHPSTQGVVWEEVR